MQTVSDFAQEVIEKFSKRITDEVFLMIENDRDLMLRYLRLVSENTLDTVNQTIGKKVKNTYYLINAERQENPKSKLIKSHQIF